MAVALKLCIFYSRFIKPKSLCELVDFLKRNYANSWIWANILQIKNIKRLSNTYWLYKQTLGQTSTDPVLHFFFLLLKSSTLYCTHAKWITININAINAICNKKVKTSNARNLIHSKQCHCMNKVPLIQL